MTALPRRTTTAARSYRFLAAVLATAAGVLALLGCSPWTRQTPSGVTLLKPPRMSPDSVVLEMALVDITTDAQLSVGELWRRADEQVLSLEARRALLQHGFRCGVLGTQLPQWLTHLLELQAERPKLEPDGGTVVVGEHLAQRRLQVRAGVQRSLPVGKHHQTLTIEPQEGSADATPLSFDDAQVFLSLETEPLGDGRVRLILVPEIKYGPMRQRWVGDDGFFRMDTSQDVKRFEDLALELTLLPGQTMVLGCDRDPQVTRDDGDGSETLTAEDFAEFAAERTPTLAIFEPPHDFATLADAMFPPRPEFGLGGRLLLLRLAQTQQDDLFAPQPKLTPIATLRK